MYQQSCSFDRNEGPLVASMDSSLIPAPHMDFSIRGSVLIHADLIVHTLKRHGHLLSFYEPHQPHAVFIAGPVHSKRRTVWISSVPPINVIVGAIILECYDVLIIMLPFVQLVGNDLENIPMNSLFAVSLDAISTHWRSECISPYPHSWLHMFSRNRILQMTLPYPIYSIV